MEIISSLEPTPLLSRKLTDHAGKISKVLPDSTMYMQKTAIHTNAGRKAFFEEISESPW